MGNGAVGLVRRAEREGDTRQLAVKFLAPDPKYIDEGAFDDVTARFRREGERGSKLDFYSFLRIHAYCENANGVAFEAGYPKNPFLLMERATGGTLEDFIRRLGSPGRNQLVLDETRLRIAIQIAEALEHLHRHHIVHRDVKPANVFLSSRLTENRSVLAKLGDFGVVKWGDFQRSVATGTLTATIQKGLGTMKYMSPEQALTPKEVSPQSDTFSFGITLFELFTGQILPSFHHVYQLMAVRDTHGTTMSRWNEVGVRIAPQDEGISELILEMLRRGVTRRPSLAKVRGHLTWEFERRFDKEWSRADGSFA
ncbi:MAG: serine/threonine protein kinase [Betaproteobacteria bacterium]|nr:serine/threonine protein kinase [Betaproteobacteria bacterium]